MVADRGLGFGLEAANRGARLYSLASSVGYTFNRRFEAGLTIGRSWVSAQRLARKPNPCTIWEPCPYGVREGGPYSRQIGGFFAFYPVRAGATFPFSLRTEGNVTYSFIEPGEWDRAGETLDILAVRITAFRTFELSEQFALLPTVDGILFYMAQEPTRDRELDITDPGFGFGLGLVWGLRSRQLLVLDPGLTWIGGDYAATIGLRLVLAGQR